MRQNGQPKAAQKAGGHANADRIRSQFAEQQNGIAAGPTAGGQQTRDDALGTVQQLGAGEALPLGGHIVEL